MTEEPNATSLNWWHSISFENKFFEISRWLSYQERSTTEKHPHTVTPEEIGEIYRFYLLRNLID